MHIYLICVNYNTIIFILYYITKHISDNLISLKMHEKIANFSTFCVQKNIPKLTLKYIVNGISDKKREKKL